jgi:hypothetical protein
MSDFVTINPLRKAMNLEKTRKNLNKQIANATSGLEQEKQYIRNNPGLPNLLSAAHRRIVFLNSEISRLKHKRNNLNGGKRKTRRHKK